MKLASSPRTSRRFIGELSCWAQGQRRFLPLLKQDFGSGWILEGPAYVGPEHCGPFRPLGMKSARQIERFCLKIEALFSEEACEEWIGYHGWPICGVWRWPQR